VLARKAFKNYNSTADIQPPSTCEAKFRPSIECPTARFTYFRR
jgi:hypothetical protein